MKHEMTRENLIFAARIYLQEARARRNQRSFSFTLLQWAADARKQAAAIKPEQGDLFGGNHV